MWNLAWFLFVIYVIKGVICCDKILNSIGIKNLYIERWQRKKERKKGRKKKYTKKVRKKEKKKDRKFCKRSI